MITKEEIWQSIKSLTIEKILEFGFSLLWGNKLSILTSLSSATACILYAGKYLWHYSLGILTIPVIGWGILQWITVLAVLVSINLILLRSYILFQRKLGKKLRLRKYKGFFWECDTKTGKVSECPFCPDHRMILTLVSSYQHGDDTFTCVKCPEDKKYVLPYHNFYTLAEELQRIIYSEIQGYV